MKRRTFLGTAAAGVSVMFTTGCGLPPFPKRPLPALDDAAGWIRYAGGRYTLYLPRAECGQQIGHALRQVAADALEVAPELIVVVLPDTSRIGRVRATVGSESIKLFALPLAQACARLQGRALPGRLAPSRAGRTTAPLAQDLAIVSGGALFAADVRLPGMLYGRVLRAPMSPELGADLLAADEAAARALPGCVAVLRSPLFRVGNGDGIGIVARTPAALERAAAALAPQWSAPAYPPDDPLEPTRYPYRLRADAMDEGEWQVDLSIEIPSAAHAAIEPRCAVAQWDDGLLRVWSGTQDPFYQRDVLCKQLGLAEQRVLVQPMRAGGAFGSRTICTVELEAALLARAVGGAVKVQWTRAQEFAQGFHRPPSRHRIRAALRAGRIERWWHSFSSSHILFTAAALPPWLQRIVSVRGDDGVARGAAVHYQAPRQRIEYALARLPYFTGPWRGLGAGPNALALESAIDECAYACAADPLDFRLAHIADPRLRAVVSSVARLSRWGAPTAPLTGRGIACGIYKGSSYAAVVAEVSIDPASGKVTLTRLVCAHDCGRIIVPDGVRAQVEGNLVWSIGMALIESLPFSGHAVAAASFADAPIARIGDVPPMEIDLIDSGEAPAGAGETAIVAGAGAIANAVRAACGLRARRFPIRSEDVLAALARARA